MRQKKLDFGAHFQMAAVVATCEFSGTSRKLYVRHMSVRQYC